jgi:hypothetical protein
MSKNLTKKVAVISRSKGSVSYSIPTLRVSRTWLQAGDSIDIPIDELLELRVTAGGAKLMDKYLMIADPTAYAIVYNEEEMIPEYQYGIEEVKYLLYEGTVEQLMDAIDYAPQGVLDLIKQLAVKKMPDKTDKIEVINKKFNINLLTIVQNATLEEDAEEKTVVRRSEPVVIQPKTPSKYKRVEEQTK